jgi:hypothetical protein
VLRTGALEAAHVTTLNRLELDGKQIRVEIDGAASNITFIGQNGVNRKTVRATNSADYTFTEHDTYIRTVIESPQTVLYLNPVIRSCDSLRRPLDAEARVKRQRDGDVDDAGRDDAGAGITHRGGAAPPLEHRGRVPASRRTSDRPQRLTHTGSDDRSLDP